MGHAHKAYIKFKQYQKLEMHETKGVCPRNRLKKQTAKTKTENHPKNQHHFKHHAPKLQNQSLVRFPSSVPSFLQHQEPTVAGGYNHPPQ